MLLLLVITSSIAIIHAAPQAIVRDLYSGINLPPDTSNNPEILSTCPYQLVALGVHGSRTSMVTRLLTLLGHYAGTQAQLTVAWQSQPLKWWEFWQIKESNNNFLIETSSSGFVNWTGIGYTGRYLGENHDALAGLMKNMSDVVRKLNRHCPWVVKEPRLCWTAGVLW